MSGDSKSSILSRIGALCRDPRVEELPLALVASWWNTDDLEVQGAAYALMAKAGRALRIDPWPSGEVVARFFRSYLGRCMQEDTSGDWTYSRYEAGWEVAGWMASLDDTDDEAELLRNRDWLADLYLGGSTEVRTALVNSALEHIFERPSLRRLFRLWRDHPVLARAYEDAALWVKEGGDSPLVGRPGVAGRSRKKQ